MNYKKFQKIVSKYFNISDTNKLSASWFNAYALPKNNEIKDAPRFQIQYRKKSKIWYVGGVIAKSLDAAYINWLEGNRAYLDNERTYYQGRESMLKECLYEESIKYLFKSITRVKKTTVVKFANGDIVAVKRRKYARDDIYTAVAFAIIKELFGSNSHYCKLVDKRKE